MQRKAMVVETHAAGGGDPVQIRSASGLAGACTVPYCGKAGVSPGRCPRFLGERHQLLQVQKLPRPRVWL